jgi:hypothetical protein
VRSLLEWATIAATKAGHFMGVIRFGCKACGNRIEIDDKFVGRRGRCSKCQTPFSVPAISSLKEELAAEPAPTTVSQVDAPRPVVEYAAADTQKARPRGWFWTIGKVSVFVVCCLIVAVAMIVFTGIGSSASTPANSGVMLNSSPSVSSPKITAQPQTPSPPPIPGVNALALPDPSDQILADPSSLQNLAASFGLQSQSDSNTTSLIYASDSYINAEGKRDYPLPSITAMYAFDMHHFQTVMIFLKGPLASMETVPQSALNFPVSSLDWHNPLAKSAIQVCCGQKVADGLFAQVDRYVSQYGSDTNGIGMDFTEGGFTISFDFGRANGKVFLVAIEGSR